MQRDTFHLHCFTPFIAISLHLRLFHKSRGEEDHNDNQESHVAPAEGTRRVAQDDFNVERGRDLPSE